MNRIKRRGPSIDPCGTPYFIIFLLDWQSQMVIYCFLPSKKDQNHPLANPLSS